MPLQDSPSKQKSLLSLRSAEETCASALAVLSDSPQSSSQDSISDQAVLHKDLVSLMSLLRGSTTKLSLALKPSSPTYNAALSPLKDISDQISAISHCVRLFENSQGVTLREEVTSVAKNIIQSVRSLLQTFLDIEKNGIHTSMGQAGDEYMVRIGTVHDTLNQAASLSTDNLTSVRKKWVQDYSTLEDGFNEVGEMAQVDPDSLEGSDEDEEDDGWGELGLGSRKMNAEEVERAKKAHVVLRLSTLLHKRIAEDVLSIRPSTPNLPSPTIQQIDTLPPLSAALLVASDDLVAALYTPQDSVNISTELASFLAVIKTIRISLFALIKELPLEGQMEAMSMKGAAGPPKDPRKWFQNCFDQIQKAANFLQLTLDLNAET